MTSTKTRFMEVTIMTILIQNQLKHANKSRQHRLVLVLLYPFVADSSGLVASKQLASELSPLIILLGCWSYLLDGLRSLTPEL